MSWKKKLTVDVFDTDFNGVTRASSFLKYLQTAATAQIQEYGPTADDLRANGLAFILSAMDVDIKRPLHAWQTVTNESWGCPGKGFTYPRCYRISDGEGEILTGISHWALLNFREKRIVRYSDEYIGFTPEEPLDMQIPRFRMPPLSELSRMGTYTVHYGVVDQNRHLNNTYYPDMFTSFIDMEGKWVRHLTIRFLKEAPAGSTLTVYARQAETDRYEFLSVREDGAINAEAIFTLADL